MTLGDVLLGVGKALPVDYWHGFFAAQATDIRCRECGTALGGLRCVGDEFVCLHHLGECDPEFCSRCERERLTQGPKP